MDWSMVFSFDTLLNSVNTGTIVVLAALGCLMTEQAGMMNIGIDGMMTASAFAAVIGSWASGSWIVGLLAALAVGLLSGLFYGVMVIKLKSDEFIIGVAFNIFAVALTTFILRSAFNQSGSFHPEKGEIIGIPSLSMAGLGLTGNISVMVPFAVALVVITHLLIYSTPLGFWLHASGEHPESLRSVGRSPEAMKFFGSLACGFFCGLSGAYLSLGYMTAFTENMSASRGFVAVACVIFGRANPLLVTAAALLFGFIDAAGQRLQLLGVVDSTLTATFPYIGTIIMMVVLAILDRVKKQQRAAHENKKALEDQLPG